jgi:cytochrome c peroxidase
LSEVEERGMRAFFSQRYRCAECHGGKNFNTPADRKTYYASHGIAGSAKSRMKTKFPLDLGLYLSTQEIKDIGMFKIPTLRNIAITSPYMHDGGFFTLKEVLSSGQFAVLDQDIPDLIAFLETLTDSSYQKRSVFSIN